MYGQSSKEIETGFSLKYKVVLKKDGISIEGCISVCVIIDM